MLQWKLITPVFILLNISACTASESLLHPLPLSNKAGSTPKPFTSRPVFCAPSVTSLALWHLRFPDTFTSVLREKKERAQAHAKALVCSV